MSQKLARLKTIKEKQQFKTSYVDGPDAFQTLTGNTCENRESVCPLSFHCKAKNYRLFSFLGIPRLFLPLVMYIIDAIFGSIKAFESQATCTSFPWLSFLNQIITFLDSNYKLLFDRLWPRRRGTGGAQDATVSGDEEDDAAGHKKKKKKTDKGGKEPEKSKKSATKTKVKKETQSTVSSKK